MAYSCTTARNNNHAPLSCKSVKIRNHWFSASTTRCTAHIVNPHNMMYATQAQHHTHMYEHAYSGNIAADRARGVHHHRLRQIREPGVGHGAVMSLHVLNSLLVLHRMSATPITQHQQFQMQIRVPTVTNSCRLRLEHGTQAWFTQR